jgi:hypothetical protein
VDGHRVDVLAGHLLVDRYTNAPRQRRHTHSV